MKKISRPALISLVLVSAALGILWQWRSGAVSPPPPNINYTGVTSRQHSFAKITSTKEEHDRNPELKLVSAMATWDLLEPSKGNFNWTQMNTNVADARDNGYKIIFRIMAGANSPDWLYSEPGLKSLSAKGHDKFGSQLCEPTRFPLPWDDTLKVRYTALMKGVASWLKEPDGKGGFKKDHIFLIPVAMPTTEGSEMAAGYGDRDTVCQDGTNLAEYNRAAWDSVSVGDSPTEKEAYRRQKMADAWKVAIDVHMENLPPETMSVVAYGPVFSDRQAAAKQVITSRLKDRPENKNRLWTMYTNLRPNMDGDGRIITSDPHWWDWSPDSYEVIQIAKAAGGRVGFQTAATAFLNTAEKFQRAAEDGMAMGMQFFETQPVAVDNHKAFLLTGSNNLQSRMASMIGKTGDINGDGQVNASDLSILLSKWGTNDAKADVNTSGRVDAADLSVLLSKWGN